MWAVPYSTGFKVLFSPQDKVNEQKLNANNEQRKNLTYITQAHNPFYDLSFFVYTQVYQMDKRHFIFHLFFSSTVYTNILYIQVLIYRLPSFSHSFTLFSRIFLPIAFCGVVFFICLCIIIAFLPIQFYLGFSRVSIVSSSLFCAVFQFCYLYPPPLSSLVEQQQFKRFRNKSF